MADSKIEWTDRVWNPVRGCALVSPGCQNCYAMKQAHRFSGTGGSYEGLTVLGKHGPRWTGRARFVPEMLDAPLRWRKPQRIFVDSMSDLFHEDVTDEEIARVWWVMGQCAGLLDPSRYRGHTFQILTKRAQRMHAWLQGWCDPQTRRRWIEAMGERYDWASGPKYWPNVLPNVQLGVSCEDQQRADERIPWLRWCPAAVRFVSAEPLLGPIDFNRDRWKRFRDSVGAYGYISAAGPTGANLHPHRCVCQGEETTPHKHYGDEPHGCARCGKCTTYRPQIPVVLDVDWIIVGGESGYDARPCNVEWIRSIVSQCADAGVACFVKQLGAKPFDSRQCAKRHALSPCDYSNLSLHLHLHDRKGGDMAEWPAELRGRQLPTVRP